MYGLLVVPVLVRVAYLEVYRTPYAIILAILFLVTPLYCIYV
jgi:hypothetical protein